MSHQLPDKFICIHLDDTYEIPRGLTTEFDPEPVTIGEMFTEATKKWADYPALVTSKDETYTYKQYYENAKLFGKALISLGVKAHEAIAMIGYNSVEWFFAFHGTWMVGSVTTGIYSTNAPDACEYVLSHSGSRVILCQGGKQLDKILSIRDQLPKLLAIVVYWPEDGFKEIETNDKFAKVYTWSDFLKVGAAVPDSAFEKRFKAVKPNQCATLVYTSGTTGNPKGVMCSHDSCTFNVKGMKDRLGFKDGDRFVSFLPLNHIAAQYVDGMLPINTRTTVFMSRPDALKGTLTSTMKKALPTVVVAVPRVYEKMMEKLKETFNQASCLKRCIIDWARSKGMESCLRRQYNHKYSEPLFYGLAKSLLLDKVRMNLGFSCTRFCVVAAAPVTEETQLFFASLDIPLYDVLGQSEGTAPVFSNGTQQLWKIGSCGIPQPGTLGRIDPVTNEIQYKGRYVMMGYLKNEEDTLQTIDSEGWLHTGDMGRMDEDGFFYVTGRLKELIVTAGGENIPPVLIENKILEIAPSFANIVVVGDKRKFLSCLISLKTEVDPLNGEPTNKLNAVSLKQSKALGSTATTTLEVMDCPKWKAYIESVIEKYNSTIAISRAQNIRKWMILEHDLSIGKGELTATLKLKRDVVQRNYKDLIENMYKN